MGFPRWTPTWSDLGVVWGGSWEAFWGILGASWGSLAGTWAWSEERLALPAHVHAHPSQPFMDLVEVGSLLLTPPADEAVDSKLALQPRECGTQ